MTTCHEETARRGEAQPCCKPAVAMRLDPTEGTPYPVCAYHTRGHGVLTLTELKARLNGYLVGQDSRRKPSTGTCHDCGRRVTGQRRLCGMCSLKRENGRKR